MRAVLFTQDRAQSVDAIKGPEPTSMLPVVDRPFLQHVIEYLVQHGFHSIDVVLTEQPQVIEAFLGDGTRWGVAIRYHLERDPDRPYGVLRGLALNNDDEIFLVGHANSLPAMDLTADAGTATRPIYCAADASGEWTGWAWLEVADVHAIPRHATRDDLEGFVMQHGQSRCLTVSALLSVQSAANFLLAQRSLLNGSFTGLLRAGREVEPGIWLSRNAVVAPGVHVEAPIFVGPDTRIGKGVRIGPNVVVGGGCVIDTGTCLRDAVVMPGSYVGAGLEIAEAVVRHDRLTSVRLDAETTITESFILDAMKTAGSPRRLSRCLGRVCALVLLAASAPFLVTMMVGRALSSLSRSIRHTAVCLPDTFGVRSGSMSVAGLAGHGGADAGWPHFLRRVLPGLLNVVLGRIDLVGLPVRTPEEVEALPSDWRALYRSSRMGLITETLVQFGPTATEPERLAAESYYSAMANWRHDLRLLARYTFGLFSFNRRASSRHEVSA